MEKSLLKLIFHSIKFLINLLKIDFYFKFPKSNKMFEDSDSEDESIEIDIKLEELYNNIYSNPHFTKERTHGIINKPLFYSFKGETNPTFLPLTNLNKNWNNVWNYIQLRYLIYSYPDLEFWTVVSKEYENYWASTEGRIWSNYENVKRIRKENKINEDDYIQIGLTSNKVINTYKIHTIIMKAFLPEDSGIIDMVNHRDGNKSNNKLINLEPSNATHNNIHSTHVLNKNKFTRICRKFIEDGTNLKDEDEDEDIEPSKQEDEDNYKNDVYYKSIMIAAIDNSIAPDVLYYAMSYYNKYTMIDKNNYKYEFIRVDERKERLVLKDMTLDDFNKEFKEIKDITIKVDDNGKGGNNKAKNLLTLRHKGYFISKIDGTIVKFSKRRNRWEIIRPSCSIYKYVQLSINHKPHTFKISRLVLIVHGISPFISIDGKQVYYWDLICDHIDHDKSNNNINNLQWITAKQNVERSKVFKPLRVENINGTFTVLPAAKVFSEFCGNDNAANIRDAARKGTVYLGNKFKYITILEYYKEKNNINTIFIFKKEPFTIYQYDITGNLLLNIFNSITAAGKAVGVSQTGFSRATTRLSVKTSFILNYNGQGIITPLEYTIKDYRNFKWMVIFGSFQIIDNNQINITRENFEKKYSKMIHFS